jgi:hypothetical protein
MVKAFRPYLLQFVHMMVRAFAPATVQQQGWLPLEWLEVVSHGRSICSHWSPPVLLSRPCGSKRVRQGFSGRLARDWA